MQGRSVVPKSGESAAPCLVPGGRAAGTFMERLLCPRHCPRRTAQRSPSASAKRPVSSPGFERLGARGAARLAPAHLAPRRPRARPERGLPVLADQPQLDLVVGARAQRGPSGHADTVDAHLDRRCFVPSEREEGTR